MKELITLPENISPRLIMLRNQPVLLDYDVAAIFGVETKRVNEGVRRDKEKFPEEYTFTLEHQEVATLRSQIATSNTGRGGSSFVHYYCLCKFVFRKINLLKIIIFQLSMRC